MKEEKIERIALCALWVTALIVGLAAAYFTMKLFMGGHYISGGAVMVAAFHILTSSLQTLPEFISGVFSLLDDL